MRASAAKYDYHCRTLIGRCETDSHYFNHQILNISRYSALASDPANRAIKTGGRLVEQYGRPGMSYNGSVHFYTEICGLDWQANVIGQVVIHFFIMLAVYQWKNLTHVSQWAIFYKSKV